MSGASWSPQQRAWLQALGHEVLVLAGEPEPPGASVAAGARDTPPQASRPGPATDATPDPLLRALLRAAGRREIGELAEWLPDAAALRGNAAGKRALWPRLRTLRKPADPP